MDKQTLDELLSLLKQAESARPKRPDAILINWHTWVKVRRALREHQIPVTYGRGPYGRRCRFVAGIPHMMDTWLPEGQVVRWYEQIWHPEPIEDRILEYTPQLTYRTRYLHEGGNDA